MRPLFFAAAAAAVFAACGGPVPNPSETGAAQDPAASDAAGAAADTPEAGTGPFGEGGNGVALSGQSAHGSSGLAPAAEAGSRAEESDALSAGPATGADAGADTDDADSADADAIVYSGGAVVWTDAGPMASEQPGGITSQCPVLGETWCSANGDLLWTCEGHVDYTTGAIVNTAPFYWNGGSRGGEPCVAGTTCPQVCTPTPAGE